MPFKNSRKKRVVKIMLYLRKMFRNQNLKKEILILILQEKMIN